MKIQKCHLCNSPVEIIPAGRGTVPHIACTQCHMIFRLSGDYTEEELVEAFNKKDNDNE